VMAATIKVGQVEATVSEGQWTCPLKSMASLLNSWVKSDYPSGGDPSIALAESAVRRLNEMGMKAELARYDEPDENPTEGTD
jgi:hypothetical protein